MNMKTIKAAAPALVIFALAVVTRAILEALPGGAGEDYSWVTTFAAIAASWVGLAGAIGEVRERQTGSYQKLEDVERNTNGKSEAERHAIAADAARQALAEHSAAASSSSRTVKIDAPATVDVTPRDER